MSGTTNTDFWFPGHIYRELNRLKIYLKSVDICTLVVDARIPLTSYQMLEVSPLINKPYGIILSKCDLISSAEIDTIRRLFTTSTKARFILPMKAPKKHGGNDQSLKKIKQKIFSLAEDRRRELINRGYNQVTVRMMIGGIPNSGKSTLINKLAGSRKSRVGAVPGITRGPKWIKLSNDFELLDTPGIFFPARIGAATVDKLIMASAIPVPPGSEDIYGAKLLEKMISTEILEDVSLDSFALQSGFISKDGYPDLARAGRKLITSYNQGLAGKFCLDSFVPNLEADD